MTTRRRRSYGARDRLTGGTKDVNPQIVRLDCVMDVSDTTQSFEFSLPVSPVSQVTTSRANVIEVFRIYCWFHTPWTTPSNAAWHESSQVCAVTTRSHGTTDVHPADSDCIALFDKKYIGAFTAGGSMISEVSDPHVMEFTDQQGHGLVIATDKLYVQLQNADCNAMKTRCQLHVHYRYKAVNLYEYIGVVTGQVAGQTA